MAAMKSSPFVRTKAIENQINEFLDKISEAGLVFEMGLTAYMHCGMGEDCEMKLEQVSELERRGDELRRDIETALYTELLIPDSRGDVLSLLEDLDYLLDVMKSTLLNISIERPDIPDDGEPDLKELVAMAVKAVESTVQASRAFFADISGVRDHIHKIGFFEREADKIALRLKKRIFDSDLPLERKLHLRDLVDTVEKLPDEAENVGDKLSIYTIKRSL
jgi:hypothetical protein